MSRPASSIAPEDGSTSRRIERPAVDLPHPDSPTRLSVRPLLTVNDTSSTACTLATLRRKKPPLTGNRVVRPRTFSSGSSVPGIGRTSWSATPSRRIGSGRSVPVISPSLGTAASSALV